MITHDLCHYYLSVIIYFYEQLFPSVFAPRKQLVFLFKLQIDFHRGAQSPLVNQRVEIFPDELEILRSICPSPRVN
jgi:hypothetical protein